MKRRRVLVWCVRAGMEVGSVFSKMRTSSSHPSCAILTEIGADMTRFPTAGHLISWDRLHKTKLANRLMKHLEELGLDVEVRNAA